MRPPSPSTSPTCRSSVAWIVPSVIGSVYSRPVRLSMIVSVSSGTARPLSFASAWMVSDRARIAPPSSSSVVGQMRRLPAEVIPRIPDPVRKVVRNTIWEWGRLTATWRGLPDFLVIGAQKAGTTALYAYLRWHPEIVGPAWKEVSFFDRHWWRGEAWYRGQFPAPDRGQARGRGEPELHLPSARARACVLPRPGRPVDRARTRARSARVLPLPARGRTRARAAVVRGRSRGGGRAAPWRGRPPAGRPQGIQPRMVGSHLRVAGSLRGAARAVAGAASPANRC